MKHYLYMTELGLYSTVSEEDIRDMEIEVNEIEPAKIVELVECSPDYNYYKLQSGKYIVCDLCGMPEYGFRDMLEFDSLEEAKRWTD